jgi:DNA-binding MarR family transcriptional regulator
MPAKFTFENPLMKTWLLIHQTHNLSRRAENAVFTKLGLTARRHSVLLAIRSLPDPVTVSGVSRWLDRSANGISMLVDRMVNDGLLNRERNMPDHREVRLTMTKKGETLLKEANSHTWQLFQSLFEGIPDKDLRNTGGILEKVRLKALKLLEIEHAAENVQVIKDKVIKAPGVSGKTVVSKPDTGYPDDEDED